MPSKSLQVSGEGTTEDRDPAVTNSGWEKHRHCCNQNIGKNKYFPAKILQDERAKTLTNNSHCFPAKDWLGIGELPQPAQPHRAAKDRTQTRSSRLSRGEACTRGHVTASLAAFPDAALHRKKGSSFFTAPKWDLHFPKPPHPQGHLTFLALLVWENSLSELSEETPAPRLQTESSGAARGIRQVFPSPSLPGNHQMKQKGRGINDMLGTGQRRRTAFFSFSLQMIFACYKSGELRQAAAENTGLCSRKNLRIPLRKHLQDQSYCFKLKAS